MSGVLPINYAKSSEYPNYKRVYVPFEDDPTTESEYSQEPLSYTRDPSFPRMWHRTSESYEDHPDFQKRYFTQVSVFRLTRQSSVRLLGTHRIPIDYATPLPPHHLEGPEHLYAVEADLKSVFRSFIWQDRPLIRQWDEILTRRSITEFVDSIISKFGPLYKYEDPPVDDIRYTAIFIKDFASYINHDIHYRDMLEMVDVKIDEDDYISIKWERDGRSLYFEIKDESVYFTKLWFQDGRLISSDGTLTKEMYKDTWKWIINGNL